MSNLYNMKLYVTNSCNLVCKHCWLDAQTEEKNLISVEQIKNVIDQGMKLGLRDIVVTGGEPTLRRDILDILDVLDRDGLKVSMETNGLLLNDKIIDKLAKLNVQVSVSLDAPEPELHDWIRGVKGSFERSLSSIKKLVARGLYVEVIMVLHKNNAKEFKTMTEFCAELGVNVLKLNPICTIGRAASSDFDQYIMSGDELHDFVKYYEKEIKPNSPIKVNIDLPCSYFSLKSIQDGCGSNGCGIKSLLSILSNGGITICGGGYHEPEWILGHIDTDTLENIWNKHSLLKAIRENLPDKLEGICSNCVFKNRCGGGCRASAMDTYSSIYAPLPKCVALYEAGRFPESRLINV